ncbi:MAG: hypothetical protein ACREQ5_34435 [Candidatus Dormibacteria bacterium]
MPPLILSGIALGLLFTPLSIAVLGSIPPAMIPKSSAFTSLSLQLGGSFSTAALVTLLANRTAFHQDRLASTINHASPAVTNALQSHVGIGHIYQLVLQQASTQAYGDASIALTILSFLLTPLVFVLAKPRPMRGASVSVE